MRVHTVRRSPAHQDAGVVPLRAAVPRARRRPSALVVHATTEAGNQARWGELLRTTPNAKAIAHNMARYLGECVPDIHGERTLLSRCIENGLRTWQDRDVSWAQPPVIAFVQGLLYPLTTAFEWEVTRPAMDGTLIWNPINQAMMRWWDGNGSIPEARRRARPADSAFVEVAPADYRTLVLVRFLAIGQVPLGPFLGRMDYVVSRYQ